MLTRQKFRIVVALAAAALGLALQSGPAFAASTAPWVSGNLVKISNNGTCLDWNYDFTNCAQGNGNQKWIQVAATGGTYKFKRPGGDPPFAWTVRPGRVSGIRSARRAMVASVGR